MAFLQFTEGMLHFPNAAGPSGLTARRPSIQLRTTPGGERTTQLSSFEFILLHFSTSFYISGLCAY